MPTAAMPDGSGNLAEPDVPEIEAEDHGDEPVSGSDQEAEDEAEAEAEVTVKKKRASVRLVATRCLFFTCLDITWGLHCCILGL